MHIAHNQIQAEKTHEAYADFFKETVIVVPCYNEEERLNHESFLEYAKSNPDVGFLFVDDGSDDGTLAALLSLRVKNPDQFAAISLSQNSGKAEAVRLGMLSAINTGATNVGYWDADLATPLEAIGDFRAILERYNDVELVYGARRMLMGHRVHRTWDRRLISRINATLARFAISLPVSDTQCGAKVFKSTKTLMSALAQPFTAGWLFDVELFSRIARRTPDPRRTFYELPLAEWEEIAGSKITSKAIIRAGFSVLGLIARNHLPTLRALVRKRFPATVNPKAKAVWVTSGNGDMTTANRTKYAEATQTSLVRNRAAA